MKAKDGFSHIRIKGGYENGGHENVKERGKRFFSLPLLCGLLLCAALLCTLLPGMSMAGTPTLYVDENGNIKSAVATLVSSATGTLNSGWYVVSGSVTRSGTLTVNGDVRLILADGASLTVTGDLHQAGINVPVGQRLTIYGQEGGTGRLTASGGKYGAGIGGGVYGDSGHIAVSGGTVTATGGDGGAGIGGGADGSAGTIAISGGNVTATGGDGDWAVAGGAGLGGGGFGDGGTIIISGGNVTATGDAGLGNGGQAAGSGGNIYITGGSVRANSTAGTLLDRPVSEGGVSLCLTRITLADGAGAPAGNAAVALLVTDTNSAYGTRDMRTDTDGRLYVYLPAGTLTTAAQTVIGGAPLAHITYRGSIGTLSDGSASGTLSESGPPVQSMVTGGSASFTAPTLGLTPLTITAIGTIDAVVATAALDSGTVTVTGVAEGSTSITVTYSNGSEEAVPVAVHGPKVAGDFIVATANVSGYSYNPGDGALLFTEPGSYTVSLKEGVAESTGSKIQANGGTPDNPIVIMLNNVKIQNGSCAFDVKGTSHVRLILMAGTANTLTSGQYYPGIRCQAGATLAIKGPGALSAAGGEYGAGIGGGLDGSGGHITVSGGTLTATGGYGAAGIGGGAGTGTGGSGGHITIGGGTLTATGGTGAAGIGGGFGNSGGGSGGHITVGGGTLTARGGDYGGAGIGGGGSSGAGSGAGGSGGHITIGGGTVTARGGTYGAGIGGGGGAGIGTGGSGGHITIGGGTVTARGGTYGAGIGGGGRQSGIGGSGGTVVISGGSINTAAGGGNAEPIGRGAYGAGSGSLQNVTGANVYLTTVTLQGVQEAKAVLDLVTNAGYAYGLAGVMTDTDGRLYLYLPLNAATTGARAENSVYSGSVATTSDPLTSAGTLTLSGTRNDELRVVTNLNYTYGLDGVLKLLQPGEYVVSMAAGVEQATADRIVIDAPASTEANPVRLTINNVQIIHQGNAAPCALTIKPGSAVSLTLVGQDNTLKSGRDYAGLGCAQGAALVIGGEGSLTATGGLYGAGIGGGRDENGGAITITGGTVIASNNYGAAGIGGGFADSGGGCGGGTITISGGSVTASGGSGLGAGIGGGGNGGSGGTITISGGTVTATGGGSGAAGIGGGEQGAGGTVVITGGSVKAVAGGGNAEPIGRGANGASGSLQNGGGANVYLTTVTLARGGTNTADALLRSLTANVGYAYGVSDVRADSDGKLYLYLPAGTKTTAAEAADAAQPSFIRRYTGNITTNNGHTGAGTLHAPIPLSAPTGHAWDGAVPGKATWNPVPNAIWYTVQLYRGGTAQGSAVTGVMGTAYDFTAVIASAGTGDYTFKVVADGDGFTYTDSDPSAASAAYSYTVPVVSAAISPDTGSFDRNPAHRADVSTTITWNDAAGVTDVKAGGASIGAGSYAVSGNTLTIRKEYLAAQPTGSLVLTVEFDRGDAATLTVTIIDTTPAPVAPTITVQPSAQTVTAGETATFSVTATGTEPLSYQWKKGGSNLTDGGNISGANAATLTITNAQASDAGSYTVEVTNSAGSTTSNSATLTVSAAPPLSAAISPDTGSFDKNPAHRADVETTITWNDATGVTEVKADGASIGAGSYAVSGNTLTIRKEYLAAQPTGSLVLTVEFDAGAPATLTIAISDTTPPAFVAVTNIFGVPSTAIAGTPLTLTGTVAPANATNQSIVWSIQNAGTTGAAISGNTLSVAAAGTVVVRATITNGASKTADYTQDFSITVATAGSTPTVPLPAYIATVSGADIAKATLPVSVNTNAGSAKADLGTLAQDIFAGSKTAVLTMPAISGVGSYTMTLPAATLSGSPREGALTFATGVGSVTVPAGMLAGMAGTEGGSAGITFAQGDKSGLPEEVKAAIGGRPIIQLTLTLDGKQTAWHNPAAPVTVSIPYTPTAAERENPESIVVWYIDGSGKVVFVPNGRYDPATGTVVFTTTHFSYYAVSYNKVSFKDVAAGAWYSKAVSFIAAREITKGTGGGNFSPEVKLTRGQFIVMLLKAYGIAPDKNPQDNFADAGNTWYTGYLAAAKRRGIATGVGSNLFAPTREITRQEMFTLLYNAMKAMGKLTPGNPGRMLSDFSDAGDIAPWAKEAMKFLVENGTVSGSGSRLAPKDTSTRAQMAQVLYSLLLK